MSVSFSVITPCLDQAAFLPECIRSVASQTHPAVEHLVFDPGSTDGSRDIAASAESVTLIAQPDQGQADAVTQGFAMAQGDVIAWLNADDRYASDQVFEQVAARFARPDAPDVVYGRGHYLSADGETLGEAFIFDHPVELPTMLKVGVGLLQPAVFFHRRVLDKVAGPDPRLTYAMDYDFWIRLVRSGARFAFVDAPLALAVVHDEAKTQTMRGESLQEAIDVARRHFGFVAYTWAQRQADWQVTGAVGLVDREPSGDEATQVSRRARDLFNQYNRNPSTVLKLLLPPWDRPALGTLSRLLGRRT